MADEGRNGPWDALTALFQNKWFIPGVIGLILLGLGLARFEDVIDGIVRVIAALKGG